MTVIKINAITVPEGMGEEVARRFGERVGAVDGTPGFEGFELLRPEDDRNQWLVVTRWVDDESFEAWRHSDSAANAHAHSRPADGEAPPHPMGLTAELWNYSVAVSSDGKGGRPT